MTYKVVEEDIQWYMNEFDLEREEVIDILEAVEMDRVKQDYWSLNPTLPENVVDDVVRQNVSASYEYHLYRTFNNEAP